MSKSRDEMICSLKRVVVPALRTLNFSGSFPHLRRSGDQKIDLFTFQFDRNGGGFIIEIAQCPREGMTTSWGKHIAPNKVSVWDLDVFDFYGNCSLHCRACRFSGKFSSR